MSENWQPGDLALCIREGSWIAYGLGPAKGQVHEVVSIWLPEEVDPIGTTLQKLFLGFAPWLPEYSFGASHFVKLRLDEADDFDREIIAEMTGQPEQVPA